MPQQLVIRPKAITTGMIAPRYSVSQMHVYQRPLGGLWATSRTFLRLRAVWHAGYMTALAEFEVILTVDARTNLLLEVITQQFELTDWQVFHEIQENVRQLRTLLASKEIKYLDLKRALVPSTDHNERAFLFDWSAMNSDFYGGQVMHCLLPVLHKGSTRSVLAGDWTARLRPSAALRDSGLELLAPIGGLVSQELPDTLYIVYLNNLTLSMASNIEAAFENLPGYVGSLDMTVESVFKALLSTMLIRDFVQHKSVILLGHEDDREEGEDFSLKLYNFAEYGLQSAQRALLDVRQLLVIQDRAPCIRSRSIRREVLAQCDDGSADTLSELRSDPSGVQVKVPDDPKSWFVKADGLGWTECNPCCRTDPAQAGRQLHLQLGTFRQPRHAQVQHCS